MPKRLIYTFTDNQTLEIRIEIAGLYLKISLGKKLFDYINA